MKRTGIVLLIVFFLFPTLAADLFTAAAAELKGAAGGEKLKPGLSVVYVQGKWRHIDKMLEDADAWRYPKKGKPIPYIDHRFGEKEVFDSGLSREVGVVMEGFLRFPETGSYRLMMKSNDGVRVFIDGRKVIDDPKVHADQDSEPGTVTVSEPGWYPIKIYYFQRKGTAALTFSWQTPGETAFRIIPEKAYAHDPSAEVMK
jgi:hypothetical protein